MSFVLKYDDRMFEPIGVQTFNPNIPDDKYLGQAGDYKYETIGNQFQFTMNPSYRDTTYLHYLDITDPNSDNRYGKAMKVVGISSMPLPNTAETSLDTRFKILCYVKFKIKPVLGVDNTLLGKPSWILFDENKIFYNDTRITGNPDLFPGLAGLQMYETNPLWSTEPQKPGVIIAIIKDNLPKVDFSMQNIIGSNPLTKNVTGSEYVLVDPITVDSSEFDEFNPEKYGYRYVQIFNGQSGTRLNEVSFEVDQPWLEVATTDIQGGEDFFGFEGPAYIPYIDEGILGQVYDPVDRNKIIPARAKIWLHIRCNPSKLEPKDGELAGTYTGYITVKSQAANPNPVRLKVTFIYLRPPYEPHLYPADMDPNVQVIHTGIRVNIKQTNSSNQKTLVFGVAPRATDGVDPLFGEAAYAEPMNPAFDARWYPLDPAIRAVVPNGFRDASPDYNRPTYNSRDVRSLDNSFESIKYLCEFNTNSYPLYITWNVQDFPEGAILFLKDRESAGNIISVNMREAAPTGLANELSYTFTNATLSSFIIEYTLPKVIQFVDEFGKPIIQKGWNLLSLPVRPTNPRWNIVYPEALNIPYNFYTDGWQAASEDLVVGKGYFIRFTNSINNNYSGAQISEISKNVGDYIRVITGWNTVGALSFPTSVDGISFDRYAQDVPEPVLDYTKKYSFWGYRPNRGFHEVSELRPGLGYFIKVGRDDQTSVDVEGYYKLVRTYNKSFLSNFESERIDTYNNSTMINLRDNAQNEGVVYINNDVNLDTRYFEMPPVINQNIFDVRFINNRNLDNTANSIVKFNGVKYPVSISMNNADADYYFYDAVSEEFIGKIERNSNKNIEIRSTNGNAVKVVKGAMDMNVYPNPVALNATVNYTIPEEGLVTVKLFDAKGNEVSTLVNSVLKADTYTCQVDARDLTSGTYLITINAGSFKATRTITVIK